MRRRQLGFPANARFGRRATHNARMKKIVFFNMDYRKVRYSLNDPYLAFWYAFVHRERTLLNAHQFEELKRRFRQQYADFSGRTLEWWFREKFRESGLYPQVGSWWDRKGENEIDLIAVNDERRIAWVFEIKRNPRKVDLHVLQSNRDARILSFS